MKKGFTLVIPLHNKEQYFKKTIQNVLENHGEYPFACLIIDDESTDGSTAIAKEYAEKYPDVFKYVWKKHEGRPGPAYARNKGIELADTEYIGFLDCDDEILPGFIDRGCNFLDEHPEYSLYGNGFVMHQYDQNGKEVFMGYRYRINNINDFMDYVYADIGICIHFCANIYKTEYVKDTLFTDACFEDVVFKYRYFYKYPHFYIDNTRFDSMIWHHISDESTSWYKQRTDKPGPQELFDTIKEVTPEWRFFYEIDENRLGWLKLPVGYVV